MKQIEFYKTTAGKQPCREWLDSLNETIRRKVIAYITRVASGGAKKNIRAIADGVFEIKIDHGPGFRVYFAEVGSVFLLLLIGGDKNTQFRDIQQAKEYWGAYEKK